MENRQSSKIVSRNISPAQPGAFHAEPRTKHVHVIINRLLSISNIFLITLMVEI